MKNKSLIVKYYKKSALYTTQIIDSDNMSAIAVGQSSKVNNGYFGADFSYDQEKETWNLWVNAKKRVMSLDKKIKINEDVSIIIEQPPQYAILPEPIDKGTVKKLQVKVLDSKGKYLDSDILPYKRRQKFHYAKTKIKIKKPVNDEAKWTKVHSAPKGYSIFVKTVEVPSDGTLKTPVAFNNNEKELIRKVAISYASLVALLLVVFYAGKLINYYLEKNKSFDVVKIDETLLEEKREKLFKDKTPVKPTDDNKPKVKKVVKAFEKSKKVEKGAPKKAITKNKKTPSRAGGKKNTKVAVKGVTSNKMKITRGGKPGAKGHFGQEDVTKSKLSKLSKLSGSIGFNANSKKKASNLYAKGSGGDFSSLRKGSPNGSKKGLGVGGNGGGKNGVGSYKVGGLGTMSLGGALKGGGTGASLSQGKTGKGFVDGLDEEIIVAGGLDRSVIERIIRRNLGDINYCYERRLNARPNLSGIFEAKFSIGANGRVQSVRAARDTLSDRTLDSCIRGSIKTWKFPRPVGGTVVNVNYPFILKST